jgi:hypothetical protein
MENGRSDHDRQKELRAFLNGKADAETRRRVLKRLEDPNSEENAFLAMIRGFIQTLFGVGKE